MNVYVCSALHHIPHQGEHHGERLTPGSAYEAIGKLSKGMYVRLSTFIDLIFASIDIEELDEIECKSCPGPGTCSGWLVIARLVCLVS
jgi:dihydroxyacid dehydratase/phosphogluconate dehydratase